MIKDKFYLNNLAELLIKFDEHVMLCSVFEYKEKPQINDGVRLV